MKKKPQVSKASLVNADNGQSVKPDAALHGNSEATSPRRLDQHAPSRRLDWHRDMDPWLQYGNTKLARGICSAPACDSPAVFIEWTGTRWWADCVEHAYKRGASLG